MTSTISETSDYALGRTLAEITMGLDALERSINADGGPLEGEGLVPIWLGSDLVHPRSYADWDGVYADIASYERDVAAMSASPRATFLRQMAASLRAAARLFSGASISFPEKLTDLVGVPAEPVDDAIIAGIHERLDLLMRQLGYTSGTLAERVFAWQTGRYLDPSVIPRVFEELMAAAKARTDAMIWPTGDYTMRLNAVRNVPYAGRCSFAEGNMDINLDVAVTRAALKHLVTHEVFPGHSTQLLSTRAVAADGRAPLDALLCTANMVTGAVQEGIGDQGIELIDWIEDEHDVAQIEVRRLQTATGTNAAWHLHMSGWTNAQSIDYLQRIGFGQASWAAVRTGMAAHAFRGPFLASYWFGNEAVRALRQAATPQTLPALNAALYHGIHSVASLQATLAA